MRDFARVLRKKAESTEDGPLAAAQEALASAGPDADSADTDAGALPLGHDFSQINVHSDEQAAPPSAALSALAHTVGSDAASGEGQTAPEMSAGQQLIAHELAHATQESAGAAPPIAAPEPDTAPEAAAKEEEK